MKGIRLFVLSLKSRMNTKNKDGTERDVMVNKTVFVPTA
jgi:hypothetical protein